eukprot:Opistho-1_new@43158
MKPKSQTLFPATLLDGLDKDRLSSLGLIIRPLEKDDYDKGFLELLSQLTKVGDVSKERFAAQFEAMVAARDTYYVVVIEDPAVDRLVACATLVVELKFIHGASKRGHIEDVVVDEKQRGRQLGKVIIDALKHLGEVTGCYKVTLDCKKDRVGFYEKCGFSNEEICFLTKRFFD